MPDAGEIGLANRAPTDQIYAHCAAEIQGFAGCSQRVCWSRECA